MSDLKESLEKQIGQKIPAPIKRRDVKIDMATGEEIPETAAESKESKKSKT